MSYYPGAYELGEFCPQHADEHHEAAAAWRRAMRIPMSGSAIGIRPVNAPRLSTGPGGHRCRAERETRSGASMVIEPRCGTLVKSFPGCHASRYFSEYQTSCLLNRN
jgi:hypothetical protein